MRRPLRLASLLLLAATLPLSAQQVRPASRPLEAVVGLALAPQAGNEPGIATRGGMVARAALAGSYVLHLVSDWPQYGVPGTGCVNGGQEVLSGTVIRSAEGDYRGTLERRTTIRFCGSHGLAQDQACSLTLTSTGPVEASGSVAAAVLALRWASAAEAAPEDIAIEGTCAPAFMASLRSLYHGVSHAVEFPLPLVGEAPTLVRLEQGWIVEAQ